MKRALMLIACLYGLQPAPAADLMAVYQRALQNDPQLLKPKRIVWPPSNRSRRRCPRCCRN